MSVCVYVCGGWWGEMLMNNAYTDSRKIYSVELQILNFLVKHLVRDAAFQLTFFNVVHGN